MSYWSTVSRAEGHWPLQDDASDTSVAALAGAVGSLVGSSTTAQISTAGPTNWLPKAFSLDGSSQYVATGMTDGAWSEGTLAVWMRPDGQQQDFSGVVVRRAQLSLYGYSDNSLHYNWSAQSGEYSYQGPSYALNEWVHLVVRVRSDRADFFLNGVLSGGNAITHASVVQSAPICIGNDLGVVNRHFKGDLAGVQVYSEALSDAEIAEIAIGPEPSSVDSPELIGTPGTGRLLRWSTGLWDTNNNGPLMLAWVLQSSDDGTSGWQDIAGTDQLSEYALPPSLASKYLRLSVTASNDGGDAETVYSDVAPVEELAWPARLVVSTARRGGLVEALARSTGELEAGLVLPAEATINQ